MGRGDGAVEEIVEACVGTTLEGAAVKDVTGRDEPMNRISNAATTEGKEHEQLLRVVILAWNAECCVYKKGRYRRIGALAAKAQELDPTAT